MNPTLVCWKSLNWDCNWWNGREWCEAIGKSFNHHWIGVPTLEICFSWFLRFDLKARALRWDVGDAECFRTWWSSLMAANLKETYHWGALARWWALDPNMSQNIRKCFGLVCNCHVSRFTALQHMQPTTLTWLTGLCGRLTCKDLAFVLEVCANSPSATMVRRGATTWNQNKSRSNELKSNSACWPCLAREQVTSGRAWQTLMLFYVEHRLIQWTHQATISECKVDPNQSQESLCVAQLCTTTKLDFKPIPLEHQRHWNLHPNQASHPVTITRRSQLPHAVPGSDASKQTVPGGH